MEDVSKLEEKFAALAQEIYQKGSVRMKPLYPWLLIRVVPKEQQFGSLILPDNDGAQRQNKPLWEGIVLATWPSHWGPRWRPARKTEVDPTKEVWKESELKVGDRVLFPHFAGVPVKYLDESKYRLVREWTWDELGGVQGIVGYDGDKTLKAKLDTAFAGVQSVTMSGS